MHTSTVTFYQLVLHLWHPCRVRRCFPILTRMVVRMVVHGQLVKPAVCFSDQQACEELIHSFIRSQTPCSAIFFLNIYSAGNGQRPNAPNFCLGPPEISKLQTLVAQIYLSGNVNEWDLQLVAILGHLNFGLFSFWITTLPLGVSSTDIYEPKISI